MTTSTIQLKRGLEADRGDVIPAAGEPLVTTDNGELFVGTGKHAGGVKVGEVHPALAGKTFLGVGTVVDSLVYDTSLDTDGGAWRHRCSDTSWYQEIVNEDASYLGSMTTTVRDTLSPSEGDLIWNTTTSTWQKYIVSADYIGEHNGQSGWQNTTRGIRAEFPSVVAVIAEATKVWIFDVTGSEPVLFKAFAVTANGVAFAAPVSIASSQGYLLIATGSGAVAANFISEQAIKYTTSADAYYKGTLADAASGWA